MKEISLENLLREHRHGTFPYDKEILSRFHALTDKVKELEAENAALKKEVEELKCCGNCRLSIEKEHLVCLKDGMVTSFYNVCSDWQSDNLTMEERNG
ncbi:MAG: hypothetical protein WC332_00655 [Clostridia bacterium]|jgi:predicted RNase H-like nuclease (RuvC/YqgF family)